jgi:hypothetical protein
LDAEGGVFGVHALSGDAFHLRFQHLVGILIGRKEHPDFEEVIQKALGREEEIWVAQALLIVVLVEDDLVPGILDGLRDQTFFPPTQHLVESHHEAVVGV